ncbi:MAG TPA: hypothetical protein VF618_18740 [Thermoanaerobaculia bacterium]
MRITITTDGGFTGRGIGSVTIDDAEMNDELRTTIAGARPEEWAPEYSARGADRVRYTLTVNGHTTSWLEGAVIPDDLQRLFDVAWGKR